MLHDILFSLLGKTGSYVKANFEIDDSLNLFSKPDLSVLNQIVELGYHYQQIEIFLNIPKKYTYQKVKLFSEIGLNLWDR